MQEPKIRPSQIVKYRVISSGFTITEIILRIGGKNL